MVTVDLKSLVTTLNPTCRSSLEAAVAMAMSRTHYNCEVEHWLLKLIEIKDGDIAAIFYHYGVDLSRVNNDLIRILDKIKTGNSRPPALSPDVVRLAREGWLLASLQYHNNNVRSGHLLTALLADDNPMIAIMLDQLKLITPDLLRRDLQAITASSIETEQSTGDLTSTPAAARSGTPTPALDQYTVNLTENARTGKIDPIVGRDSEIRQIIDILSRRRQNNPILTGEAGVGKSAVVEGFASRIASGDVPPALQNVEIHTLDLGLLQAGAGMKGEFENRLKSVISEVKSSAKPIILFIDEAHTLIGAGGQAGQNDAANLLKPALARGELRTIAATTWAEYKKYFEKDPALTRRFQLVKIEEPSDKSAIDMLRGLVPSLEAHHKVHIIPEAVIEAVRLSRRYIPSRQLPDKALSLLDTACGRVNMSQNSSPPAIEDLQHQISMTNIEIEMYLREKNLGSDDNGIIATLKKQQSDNSAQLVVLEARLQAEQELVNKIKALQNIISESDLIDEAKTLDLQQQLHSLRIDLKTIQGESPFIHILVDGQAVAAVVASWTGIPVGRMASDEIKTILNIENSLATRIIGQDHALHEIAQVIWTARAKLTDPRKPIGVFLMVGTSGTGKTETALALADLLYGGEQNVTTINMTEFKEEHKVSLLMGSPPGYVGYGEGGILTEAVRRRPYSILLLDEMEKAHPGVQDIFFQIFDKGILRDGEGRDIDFKNTIIIMTSNAGSNVIHSLFSDAQTAPDAKNLTEALRPELLKIFKPAFLGRLSIVPYLPLNDQVIRNITILQLKRIAKRFFDNYNAQLTWTDVVIDTITARCTEVTSGARNIEHILSRSILPLLSAKLLNIMASGQIISHIVIDIDTDKNFTLI